MTSLTFQQSKIVVNNIDNTSSDFYFSDIVKITFNEEGTAIIENAETSKTNVYPNPVKDNLTLTNAGNLLGSDICIYSTTGQLVAKHSQWNGESIDVSHLTPGVYFVNTNSTTLKFVKQ